MALGLRSSITRELFGDVHRLTYSPPRALTRALAPRSATDKFDSVRPVHRPELVRRFVERLSSTQPLFVCVAAHTDTSGISGVSSAGASLDLIPFTAAADIEALREGRPGSLDSLPSNPLGPPGPALITRASLALSNVPWLPVTIGLRRPPRIPTLQIPAPPGGDIRLRRGIDDPHYLFRLGHELGVHLCQHYGSIVIGETVPGGTTTAMAVLRALGLPSRVSASSAGDVQALKRQVVDAALRRAKLPDDPAPFRVLREMGDPMQPFVAGMVLGTGGRVPVVLAGGTQMAAVLAVVQRLERSLGASIPREGVLLATTPWVARDPHADLVAILAAGGNWPAAVPALDFSAMRCEPLRAYERFLVKEGVGAGGAALTALTVANVPIESLHAEIDAQYQCLLAGR